MRLVKEFTSRKSNPSVNRSSGLKTGFLPDELRLQLVPTEYEGGAQLCSEGQPAAGIFSICAGEAKEYFTSPIGKTAIIRIVKPGDVVGLEGVMGDSLYATTVEAIEPLAAYFIPTRELLSSMRSDENFRLAVTKRLSDVCRCAYNDIRQFDSGIPARFARFLLQREQESARYGKGSDMSINLTREEIAQTIGSTRETISRIVGFLRKKGWILVSGTKWKILNRTRLTALVTQ